MLRAGGDVEMCSWGEVVEGDVVRRGVVGVVVPELGVNLFLDGAAEGYACGVASQEDGYVGREEGEVEVYQTGVVGLPLMAVGLDGVFVLQPGVEVSHLVQQH